MPGKFHKKRQQPQLGHTWFVEESPGFVFIFRRVVYQGGSPVRPNTPVQE